MRGWAVFIYKGRKIGTEPAAAYWIKLTSAAKFARGETSAFTPDERRAAAEAMTNEIFMVLDRLGVFDFWIYDKLMRVRDAAKPRPSAISSLRPCEDDPRSAVACLLRGKIVNLHLICMQMQNPAESR